MDLHILSVAARLTPVWRSTVVLYFVVFLHILLCLDFPGILFIILSLYFALEIVRAVSNVNDDAAGRIETPTTLPDLVIANLLDFSSLATSEIPQRTEFACEAELTVQASSSPKDELEIASTNVSLRHSPTCDAAAQTEIETVSCGTQPDPFNISLFTPAAKTIQSDDKFVEIEHLCDEVDKLTGQLAEVESVRIRLEGDLTRTESEKQKIVEEFTVVCREMLVKKNGDAEEIESLKAQNQNLNVEMNGLKEELRTKERLIDDLQLKLDSVVQSPPNESFLPEELDTVKGLKERISNLENHIDKLEQNVIDVGEENQRLNTQSFQIDCLKGELEDCQKESGEKDQKIQELMELIRNANHAVKSQSEGLSRLNLSRGPMNESLPGNTLRDATTSPFSARVKRSFLSLEKLDVTLQTDSEKVLVDAATATSPVPGSFPVLGTPVVSPNSRKKRSAGEVGLQSALNRKKLNEQAEFEFPQVPEPSEMIRNFEISSGRQSFVSQIKPPTRRPLLDSNLFGTNITGGRLSMDFFKRPAGSRIPATPRMDNNGSFLSLLGSSNRSATFDLSLERPNAGDYPARKKDYPLPNAGDFSARKYDYRLRILKSGSWSQTDNGQQNRRGHSENYTNHPVRNPDRRNPFSALRK